MTLRPPSVRPLSMRAGVRRIGRRHLLVVIVVVAAAAIVYEQTIPVTSVVRARLAHLVVAPLGLPGYTEVASRAQQVPSSSNPFAAVKAAATHDPDHTGGYFSEWKSPASKYRIAEILAAYVPTNADSRTTLRQAETQYLGRTTYSDGAYVYQGAIASPGIAGSVGAFYESKATKTVPATTLAVTAFRQGVVVVVIDTLGTDPTSTRDDNVALARRQQTHLAAVEPTFTLMRTTRPALATAIFAAATVGVAVAGLLLLAFATAARRRSRARRAARARYEVQGQRIVKHRRPTTR